MENNNVIRFGVTGITWRGGGGNASLAGTLDVLWGRCRRPPLSMNVREVNNRNEEGKLVTPEFIQHLYTGGPLCPEQRPSYSPTDIPNVVRPGPVPTEYNPCAQ